MPTCTANDVDIQDLRNHPKSIVLSLREVLCSGATLIPDPKRRGIYEVRSEARIYYIYVTSGSGEVQLLATWPNVAGQASGTAEA